MNKEKVTKSMEDQITQGLIAKVRILMVLGEKCGAIANFENGSGYDLT